MKRFMIILAVCFSFIAKGQMTVGMSGGGSNNHAFIQAEAGYTVKNWCYVFNLRAQPAGNNAAAFFGAKTYYAIHLNDFHFGPVAGLYYKMKSTDNKSENGNLAGYGLKAGYKWFSAEAMQIGHYTQLSIGVFAFIITQDRCK